MEEVSLSNVLLSAILSSLFAFGVWIVFQPSMLLDDLGEFLDEKIPEIIARPLFRCPTCMSFWYSGLLSMTVLPVNPTEVIIIMVAATGFSAIISNHWQDDSEGMAD